MPEGGVFSSVTPPFVSLGPLVPSAGEIGMVSRGTGEEGLAVPLVAEGASRVAMLSVGECEEDMEDKFVSRER